jgi:hypothetical protein
MHGMSDEVWYVHTRLEEWGRWACGPLGAAVAGYPARSAHERIKEGGLAAGLPKPPVDMPEPIAYTDTAVARLAEVDKEVVRAYYLHWAPQETLWKGCAGIRSLSNFKSVLKRARWRVRMILEELEVS